MSAAVQPYIFSQIGLDSGALTLLGAVVHRFADAGEYRGVATDQGGGRSVFLNTVDEKRPAVQVDVDLATLTARPATLCPCGGNHGAEPHLFASTKAHVVFHVSGGPGGYSVHLTRAEKGPQPKAFDTTRLDDGDIFAATILRPGLYSLTLPRAKGQRASLTRRRHRIETWAHCPAIGGMTT